VSGHCEIDSAGQFQFTTTMAALGQVTAVGMLGSETFTESVSALVSTPAPMISLNIAETTETSVSYSGMVTGIDFAGLTVSVNQGATTAVTDIQGFFHFSLSRQTTGMISVSATDLWGQVSNDAQVDAPPPPPATVEEPVAVETNLPPDIDVFRAEYLELENGYRLYGHVCGENVEGLVITFSGILEGTAIVDANGDFVLDLLIPAGTSGVVYAQTTQNNLASNLAECNL
jgi:hypothetical protein